MDEKLDGLGGNESNDAEVGEDIAEDDGMANGDGIVGGEDAVGVELVISRDTAANMSPQSMKSSRPSPGDRLLEISRPDSICACVPSEREPSPPTRLVKASSEGGLSKSDSQSQEGKASSVLK